MFRNTYFISGEPRLLAALGQRPLNSLMDRLFLILGCCVFVFRGVFHFALTIFTRKFERIWGRRESASRVEQFADRLHNQLASKLE